MSLKAKYQYTHFIYPFVIDNKDYFNFINQLFKNGKEWKFVINEYKNDEELFNFYLPYMRKFLFPTLFWTEDLKRRFKVMSSDKRASIASKCSCINFSYNLSNIKNGILPEKQYSAINFDVSKINIICFEPGICFLDIKTEIDETNELIDFNKILDFNYSFRNLTPKTMANTVESANMKAKNIDNLESISSVIKNAISGFETGDLEKIYYDKLFTYSYVCVDGWEKESDFKKYENDFLKFQYVMDSKSTAIFNDKCNKLQENMYSRWQYSMFGFSRESGVVFVSDKEKYNITRMPYNFEKTYLHMLFLAFYQRISLINFLQHLLKQDITRIEDLNTRFTKFTNISWFSQITNSEHGMDIWEKWQDAFELQKLYDEVHKEYLEYYDFVMANRQSRINVLLIIIYVVSVIFTGLQILDKYVSYPDMDKLVIIIMLCVILIYPVYSILRWLKYRIKAKKRMR